MTDPNAMQAEYWNSRAGRTWVEREAFLDATLAPVLDRVLELVGVQPGETLLDIGCGTGASTLAAAGQTGPDGAVMGVDIAAQLLDRARQRATGLGNAQFVLADAQTYGFEAGGFDAVFSRFGVMFFDDTVAAFANIAKALKPGGRMVFAAWGPIAGNPFFSMTRDAAIARLGMPSPLDPLAPGPMALQDPGRIMALLELAGWRDVQVVTESVMLTPLGSVAEVAGNLSQVGPAVRIMLEKNGTAADGLAIAQGVAAAMAAFSVEAAVRIPARINFVSARIA